MTDYYVDLVNGNNANSGLTSWANAKRWTNQITALAAGDRIKIASTPNSDDFALTPTMASTTSVSSLAVTGTLSCKTILLNFSAGAGAWTAANSATVTTSSSSGLAVPEANGGPTRNAGQLAFPASPAINTKYGFIQITSVDLSAYQELAIYVGVSTPNNAAWQSFGCLVVKLCSDTTGDVPVDTFSITPTVGNSSSGGYGGWVHVARTGGGNMGAAIQSIALYSGPTLPQASGTVYISCPTAHITNPPLRGGDVLRDTGYNIVRRASLIVNGDTSTPTVWLQGSGLVFNPGLTGLSMVRIRPYMVPLPDKQFASTSFGGTMGLKGTGGTSGSRITIAGGWNTGTDIQNSRTFYDGSGGANYLATYFWSALDSSVFSYTDFQKIWLAGQAIQATVSYSTGSTANNDVSYTDCGFINSQSIFYAFRFLQKVRCTNCLVSLTSHGSGTRREVDIGLTNCVLSESAWSGGQNAENSGTVFYTSCTIINSILHYTGIVYGSSIDLLVTFTSGTVAHCDINAESYTNSYTPTRLTFSSNPCTFCRLLMTPPVVITGYNNTDTNALYLRGIVNSYAQGFTYVDRGMMCKMVNCTVDTWMTNYSVSASSGLWLVNTIINFRNTTTQPTVELWDAIFEDSQINNFYTASKPNLTVGGHWCRMYRCSFDNWNQIAIDQANLVPTLQESPYKFIDCATTNITQTPSIQVVPGVLFVNTLMDHAFTATSITGTGLGEDAFARFFNFQRTVGDHRLYSGACTIRTETGTVHTAGGRSWKISVTGTVISSREDSLEFAIGRVALAANKTLTASVWVLCNSGQLAFKARRDQFEFGGVQPQKRAVSATTGAWEKLSWTYTPVIDGVLEVYITIIAATASDVMYFDDLNFAQV